MFKHTFFSWREKKDFNENCSGPEQTSHLSFLCHGYDGSHQCTQLGRESTEVSACLTQLCTNQPSTGQGFHLWHWWIHGSRKRLSYKQVIHAFQPRQPLGWSVRLLLSFPTEDTTGWGRFHGFWCLSLKLPSGRFHFCRQIKYRRARSICLADE